MLHFYKPNAKVTGTACSFYLNKNDNSFFSTLIKQDSWNAEKRIGSFSKNKNNPAKKVNIKFSQVEIAGIIDAIESNREFSGYHGSNQIVKFKFGPYMRGDEQVGFSYSVNKESKEDSTDKTNFLIGFYFTEARLLKEHLQYLLRESFVLQDESFVPKPQKTAVAKPQEEDEEDLW